LKKVWILQKHFKFEFDVTDKNVVSGRNKNRDGVVKSAKVQHLIQASTFSLFNIVFVSVDVASDLATAANFWMINQNMLALATLLPVFAPLFARSVK
jgi:hypothetical protein